MIHEVTDAAASTRAAFDAVIDVRSPAEFAEDHPPGAINLPVLSNAERAEVGTLYVQRSKFLARRVGAAYVARNIAGHLDGALADRPASFAPLVYCWRGGQRSNAMATVLSQVGWRVGLLTGGYKTYRRLVAGSLYDQGPPLRVVLLAGPTGVGKTALLPHLAARGVQTLDLEALAAHRGSLFGDLPGTPQPSQKMFESRLLDALDCLDAARPIVVEAESSRIGALTLPPRLWSAMRAAPAIELAAPPDVRARRIAATYAGRLDDPPAIAALLARLPRHHGRELRAHWADLAATSDAEAFAQSLIETHYDAAYRRAGSEDVRRLGGVVEVGDDPAALELAAERVSALVGIVAGGFSSRASRLDDDTVRLA